MDKPVGNVFFRLMGLQFWVRDLILPREKILREVEIQPDNIVVDFGCGTGSYSVVAGQIVGPGGKVYAVDINPLAIETTKKAAQKKGLKNIETINSDCITGLKEESVDVALLYDTLHGLSEPQAVLQELHRILKPQGVLSVSDHHIKQEQIISRVTEADLFKLAQKCKYTYTFKKN
jgi:ubiquinone/menaquinone biosynthesis C-methylase UbiE